MELRYFRWILGVYLTIHFIGLVPYAEELFGSKMPYNPKLSPVYGIFPNIFSVANAQQVIAVLVAISVLFTLGVYSKACAFTLWYGWAAALNRNVLIYNPGIPYVGWCLLMFSFVPSHKGSKIPKNIFWLAWLLMGMGYTVSGLHKLQCESWLDGTALTHVLNGPLAHDNFLRDMLVSAPPIVLKLNTWFSLALEISFMPLGLFYHTRFWFWIIYMIFHIGILMLINFSDLTAGVLMIHFLTFDENWIWQKNNP